MNIFSLKICLALILIFLIRVDPGYPQPPDEFKKVRKEMDEIQEAQRAIQKEFQEIKGVLRARGLIEEDPQNLYINIPNRPFKGDPDARLILIEFSEYQCPYCARHVRETWPQIQKNYIDTGKVKYFFFDFPLESIHKKALKAAEAGRCAGDQGKFWEMHDLLFAQMNAMETEDLMRHARGLHLNAEEFQQCLETRKFEPDIRKDIADGQRAGVRGTPTFLIGVMEPNATKMKALKRIRGAQPFPAFKEVLDSLLIPQK